MASAQVLPAKKQKLLAAGKERLAEFRRQKALEKAKNAASTQQSRDSSDNKSLQTTQSLPGDPVEVGPSSQADRFSGEFFGGSPSGNETVYPDHVNGHVSSNAVQSLSPFLTNENSSYASLHTAVQEPKLKVISSHNSNDAYEVIGKKKGDREESENSEERKSLYTTPEPYYNHNSAFTTKENIGVNTLSSVSYPDGSQYFSTAISSSGISPGDKNFDSSFSFVPTPYSAPSQNSELLPSYSLSGRSFLDHALTDITKFNSRKSRPSFLDTIKVPPPTPFPSPVEGKQISIDSSTTPSISNVFKQPNMMEALNSPISDKTSGKPLDFPVYSNSGSYQSNGYANGSWREYENTYHSVNQKEDFSALEQHIEDLTQEKFSLQRAVEASRELAESLAAENSSLTDNYNQQGSAVNQMKSEMERLQEEIRGQSIELEAIKSEYSNALLECNAADERAKLLASEVISLEEKVLRLRSNELKLERQLENALSEASSLKKKMSSLEREREDLHASISAFQEEKKMLQSKLQKLHPNGRSHAKNNPSNKKNASTSTDDIVYEDSAESAGTVDSLESHTRRVESSSKIIGLIENSEVDVQPISSSIPGDQMGVIQNINALLSELALEKEELIITLKAESSECSKFKELNKELSKRLEIQTQRLKLLTAQSMAGQSISTRQSDFSSIDADIRDVYADEGDEVVERVMGWIMKLFPGGPSKRRRSALI